MLSRSDFHDYQEAMVDFALNTTAKDTDSVAEWAGMGTGKTVVAETVASYLLDSCEVSKVLVVSPKTAAQHTWSEEHLEWSHLAHLDVRLITPTHEEDNLNIKSAEMEQIIKGRMRGGDVHVINPERLTRLVQMWGREWPYDMVIVDDTKGLKTPSSKTFARLRQVSPKINRFMITNGTPMPNGYIQLWPQIYLLDQGARLKTTHRDYKQKWFMPNHDGRKWIPRSKKTVRKIQKKLSDICISIDGGDYLDLPEEERYVLPISLTGKLREEYEKLEADFYLELEDGEEVIARSKGIAYNKLKQYCNGAVFTDPLDDSKWSVIHDKKLDLLEDLMEELSGENIIIAYQYKPDLVRMQKRFGSRLHNFKTTSNVKKRWNNGELRMLAMHPGSAGHGLNLQWGGRTIVWFGAEWSLELNDQMEERVGAVRQVQSGLNARPRYYHICIDDSIETLVTEAVMEKRQTQDGLKHSVRLELKNRQK